MENSCNAYPVRVGIVEEHIGADGEAPDARVYLITLTPCGGILGDQPTCRFKRVEHAVDSTGPIRGDMSCDVDEILRCRG